VLASVAPAVLTAALLCGLLPPPAGPPVVRASGESDATRAGIDARRQKLAKLKAELENERKLAAKLRGEENKVLEELESVDKRLDVMKRYLVTLEAQEQALDQHLAELATEIDARQAELDASHDRLAYRIRQLYKQGRPTLVEVAFTSESLPDLFRQVDFMMRMADEEKRLMTEIEQTKLDLMSARQEVEKRHLEARQVRAEEDRERSALIDLRAARGSHLHRIRTERHAHEAAAAELAAAQKELEQLIRTLESRLRQEGEFVPLHGPFADARGRLPWPARGAIVKKYGEHVDREHLTKTFNNGIDIGAAAGSPIRVVADGKVAFRDWLAGYGNFVVVNHGGGYYTLYAHAADFSVTVGQVVSSGDVIGHVGETGSIDGTKLHFEIRRESQSIDPTRWLAR
jgi:septal ring factor EnvC (AmiA/AmiB activator)